MNRYLDYVISIGSGNTDRCIQLMNSFEIMCREFGEPLKEDKTLQPTTCLIFLGLEIETIAVQIRIPYHKVAELAD